MPLIAFPTPSITRKIAQDALDRHKILWRIVCTCASLSGLTAAARAGMGVLVQPRSMAPDGLKEVAGNWLPPLEDVEFVIVPRRGADVALVEALSDLIVARLVRMADEQAHARRCYLARALLMLLFFRHHGGMQMVNLPLPVLKPVNEAVSRLHIGFLPCCSIRKGYRPGAQP